MSIKRLDYRDLCSWSVLGLKWKGSWMKLDGRVSNMMINNMPDRQSKMPDGIRNTANDQTLHFLLIKFGSSESRH